jgi:hypothetical protein
VDSAARQPFRVASGTVSERQLADAGADAVLGDLMDSRPLLETIARLID